MVCFIELRSASVNRDLGEGRTFTCEEQVCERICIPHYIIYSSQQCTHKHTMWPLSFCSVTVAARGWPGYISMPQQVQPRRP